MSAAGLTVAEANNFLALEPRLLALIAQAVAGLSPAVHVLSAADIPAAREAAQRTPAVLLVYGGYRVVEDLRTAWRLAHTWHVVVTVRNVATARSGQAARQDAGPLLARVMTALAGAAVEGAATLLTPVTPAPAQYEEGFQAVPSAFEVETIFRKP